MPHLSCKKRHMSRKMCLFSGFAFRREKILIDWILTHVSAFSSNLTKLPLRFTWEALLKNHEFWIKTKWMTKLTFSERGKKNYLKTCFPAKFRKNHHGPLRKIINYWKQLSPPPSGVLISRMSRGESKPSCKFLWKSSPRTNETGRRSLKALMSYPSLPPVNRLATPPPSTGSSAPTC